MRAFIRNFLQIVMVAIAFAVPVVAQQIQRTPFDVKSYQIDAQLVPIENKLVATADVIFVPLEDTRSVSFEMNGSLKIDTISRVDLAVPGATVKTPGGKGKAPATSSPVQAGAI